MTDEPLQPDDDSEVDAPVYSRYYQVPIAHDVDSGAIIIPAEATPRLRQRYRCCFCRRFLRLATRWAKADRPPEKWYFCHLPGEGKQCGGESYEHAIAIAAATWVLTRHLEGMTVVRSAHRCGRCEEVSQHVLPRDGLRVLPDAPYPGTSWRSDLALATLPGAAAWGLEILTTHAVDRLKAAGIPCPWAEVKDADLVDIIADPKRRSRREVTLVAQSGRADQAPLQATGEWYCAACRALPPLYQLPAVPVAGAAAAGGAERELGRRSMVSRLAQQLRTASGHKPFRFVLPQLCPTHQVPKVLTFGSYHEAKHLVKPRQTAKRLSWDLTFEAVIATGFTPPHPLGVLVVGSKPHPAAPNGRADLPSIIPYLVVNQATISNGRAVVLDMNNVTLVTTCPSCEEEERVAAAERERSVIATMEQDARISAYAKSCRRLLVGLKDWTPHLDVTDECDLMRQIDGFLSSHVSSQFAVVERCARNLTDDDVAQMFARRFVDSQHPVGIVPPGDRCLASALIAYVMATYGPHALRQKYLEEGRDRMLRRRARLARFDRWDQAARAVVYARQQIRDWQPAQDATKPLVVPTHLSDGYRTAFASMIEAAQDIRSNDALALDHEPWILYDPLTHTASTDCIVHIERAVDRLRKECDPDRVIKAELTHINKAWEVMCSQRWRSELMDLVNLLELRGRDGLSSTALRDSETFSRYVKTFCEGLAEKYTAAVALLRKLETSHPDGHVEADMRSRLDLCHPLLSPHHWHMRYRIELQDLNTHEAQEREFRILTGRIQSASSSFSKPPPPPVDYSRQIAAVIVALRNLRSYLLSVPDGQEWETAGAPIPEQVRSALFALPVPHRPSWVHDIDGVMRSGIGRMSSLQKRRQLLLLIESLPEPGHNSAH